ncbi:MAG TPA: carbonic anhydrase [Methanobacteriaceae archaeon]|nr:carbonic anhydrase [Methanobacteriaceae archaeon]
MKNTFATAINCIDGRVQLPVRQWLIDNYSVDSVVKITAPGPDKLLHENQDIQVEVIKNNLKLSVETHEPVVVAVVGHYDCVANPVEKDVHLEQIKAAITTVKSWNFSINLVGLWVDDQWSVSEVNY